MFGVERRATIIDIIDKKGNVSISELTELFNVSGETIRKDLLMLEKDGALERTHGGAVKVSRAIGRMPLVVRKQSFVKEKYELCQNAVLLINNGDFISIDAGSTAYEFAKLIVKRFSELTVLTNSVDVMNVLSENEGITVILTGGEYYSKEAAFVGHITCDTIKNLHTCKAFIFPAAISLEYGLTEYQSVFIDIQRAYMNNTDRVYLLADSDKFEIRASYKICDVDKNIAFVTDKALKDEIAEQYINSGFEIYK